MPATPIAVIILAAGLGTRMKSARSKVLHAVAGRPMIGHVMASVAALKPARSVVVIGPEMTTVAKMVAPTPTAVQRQRRGTAHAVLAAREALKGFKGEVLVVYGDTPLVRPETLRRLVQARRKGAAVVVAGIRPPDPTGYGRLVIGSDGGLERIVEHRDASDEERQNPLCNSGVMAIDGRRIWDLLARVRPNNAKREYYLTDIVGLARKAGLTCAHVEAPAEDLLGINSRAELAAAEALFQERLRQQAMTNGVTLVDPASVWFCYDTRLGRDVTIGPQVIFGPGVTVGDQVEIRGFCHLEGAKIGKGAQIGPFARLRPGARIGAEAHIGNFVEVKNADIAPGAKVNHLTYMGDASVGAKANIGAGTITCNYDGYFKSRTVIGAGAFIGSNSALVAPVRIGKGAIVGAGSVIVRAVPPEALAVGRGPQVNKRGWAKAFRAERAKAKAAAK